MRKTVVNKATGLVANVIVLEDGANWPVPAGHLLVDAEAQGSVGDTWDGFTFTPHPELLVLDIDREAIKTALQAWDGLSTAQRLAALKAALSILVR